MSSKKFLISTVLIIILIAMIISAFNYYTDPFGVFSDKSFNWMSYNFTSNPRTAKINYLDSNHNKYNSYIIGSSGASAIPVASINEYSKQEYFNLFYYGADMLDSLNTVRYLVDNYEVQEILLPISFSSALDYNKDNDSLNYKMNYKVENTSFISFWSSYLFANPNHGIDKIKSYYNNSYFQEAHDVFIPETGEYDKSIRDIEYIDDLNLYLQDFPSFGKEKSVRKLGSINESMAAISDIKKICDGNNIKLTVLMYPMYIDELNIYMEDDIDLFFSELGKITDYWDFTYSNISKDPRYFYDESHYRNSVGHMILGKIYGDHEVYIPENFGSFVKQGDIRTTKDFTGKDEIYKSEQFESDIPILMFHHISDEVTNTSIISQSKFYDTMKYLKDNNYNTVNYKDLSDYVTKGEQLPNNPIMITFDDGYLSNYEIGFPILKEMGQKASIFVIASSVGKDTYKLTNNPIIPHFTMDQMLEMVESGLIDIGSHSYDMHQSKDLEEISDRVRINALKLEEESEEEYIQFFKDDINKFNLLYSKLGLGNVEIYAYPLGKKDVNTEVLLSEMGIKSTFTIEKGNNRIIKGLPQSLFSLKRNNVSEDTDIEELLQDLMGDK